MLSPQTLADYVKQQQRYAEGSLDIFFSRNNPLVLQGLTLRQRISYFETFFSYFSPLWLLVFLLSPIVFFFTLSPPIKAFNFDFFIHFLSFAFLNIILTTVGNWGVSTVRSEQFFIAGFWIKIKALFKVLTGANMKFNVTSKTRGHVNSLPHILPHLSIIIFTLAGLGYNSVLILKGLHPSYSAFTANIIWSVINFYQLSAFIRSAFWKTTNSTAP
jgi:cellulose synthase (UDP-forming)